MKNNLSKLIEIKNMILFGTINTEEGIKLYKKEKFSLIKNNSSSILKDIKTIDDMIPLDLN
jgi:hypothetical protein